MKNSTIRASLAAALIALAGEAAALGLGELRGATVLGERARFEVELLGSGTAYLDPTCFRLKQPVGDTGLPWLKQATFAVRHGAPAVLEVRAANTLTDPAFAVAVYVGCGHDIIREYTVLASRPMAQATEPASAPAPRASTAATKPAPRRQAVAPRPVARSTAGAVPPPATPASAVPPAPAVAPAPEAAKGQSAQDSTTPADEKIKRMEATVGELQQRAAELTQKIEQAQPAVTPPAPAPAVAPPVPKTPVPVAAKPEEGSNWGLYGALLAILAVVAGVLGWRGYSQRRETAPGSFGIPDVVVDPQRRNEREERGGADLQVDPVAMVTPAKIAPVAPGTPPAAGPGVTLDSLMSVSAATVDEHFEANPVMELAEIMLSFGRVKGAAQALQEYIDANPQDALKPWVRLMDVYRMAGMRHEFEKVARELNKNFNVQVQQWETLPEGQEGSVDVVLDVDNARSVPALGADEGIEGMAWIMEQVMMRWPAGDVVDYLNQLLRDNRGGTRAGFSLPVVNDIMFLIDLKEFSSKIDGEAAKA